jgi:hypothetical protein
MPRRLETEPWCVELRLSTTVRVLQFGRRHHGGVVDCEWCVSFRLVVEKKPRLVIVLRLRLSAGNPALSYTGGDACYNVQPASVYTLQVRSVLIGIHIVVANF